MFNEARQDGADRIIALAAEIASELSKSSGRSVRVVGWRGSGGKMDWEYVVEVDGRATALEVGDSNLLEFASDERIRTETAARIRYQLASALRLPG